MTTKQLEYTLTAVTTILAGAAEQVVDREPITRADWEAMKGCALSVEDTGGRVGQAYRIELVAYGRVLDSYDTTTQ